MRCANRRWEVNWDVIRFNWASIMILLCDGTIEILKYNFDGYLWSNKLGYIYRYIILETCIKFIIKTYSESKEGKLLNIIVNDCNDVIITTSLPAFNLTIC